MISPILAKQLQRGVKDYLHATYPMANEPFRSSFTRFLDEDGGLYLEPHTSVKLPFRSAGMMPTCFEAVEPKFVPYVHQQKAFDRLVGDDGRSTLIATGTGSGKTECFLYPILEYCYQHREKRGVKALIIYPMNALASDQAGRIAKLIWNTPKLKGNVTVGLYVGGLGHGGTKLMGEEDVITDRDTMQSNPPDILLTNYKMLDYLLVRPGYTGIWDNGAGNALRYVAVDELHTFDGAQGTDLACLLRRLKSRLSIQRGQLCCVGTSATMGGPGSREAILKYACDIFGEEFEGDAVITEDRLGVDEFLAGHDQTTDAFIDADAEHALLRAVSENDEVAYLQAALDSCVNELAGQDVMDVRVRLEIPKALLGNLLFRDILQVTKGRFFRSTKVAEDIASRHSWLGDMENPAVAIDAIAALIGHARTGNELKLRPFLNVQTQMWERELARFTAEVGVESLHFDLSLNLSEKQRKRHMLMFSCRDCGQTAWVSTVDTNQHMRTGGLDAFYNEFFGKGENVVAAYPREGCLEGADLDEGWLCPECMHLELPVHGEGGTHLCHECDTECVPVAFGSLELASKSKTARKQYLCPCCGSAHGASLVGLRNTTQAEVAITQMFGSRFDDDNKALLFNDNVQDASHRAGFLNSRAYRFGLRSALAGFLADGGAGLALNDFADGAARYYEEMLSREEFVARFLGPNNFWMRSYVAMLETGKLPANDDARKLVQNVRNRLRYEILLEFGMRRNVGRTLEKSLVADIEFERSAVNETAGHIVELAANELGVVVSTEGAKELLLAFLNLLRNEGAIVDAAFESFARDGANQYLLTNRHTHYLPGNSHANTPRFLMDGPTARRGFAHVSSPQFRRLPEFVFSDEAIDAIGLMECVKRAAVKAGLLVHLVEDGRFRCLGLSQGKMIVTGDVIRLRCDACGAAVPVAKGNLSHPEELHCLRAGCGGRLRLDNDQRLDYYGSLFSKGAVDRIEAKEHTGLLQREEREELERRFKASGGNRLPWYPNVLSCTPTLEMGIDIGDLSSLVMCGMPPGQAQFQQRAGRAGRLDGNAFCAVLADASPHGMYFYGDPLEMAEGEVEPPHVFLHAPAVLERQFIAFCMDRWIVDMREAAATPDNMRSCLSYMAPGRQDATKFPYNFLNYAKNHIRALTSTFLSMFSEDLAGDDATKAALKLFAQGSGGEAPMYVRILSAFQDRYAFRESYLEQQRVIQKQIDELEALPSDSSFEERLKELRRELHAVSSVVKGVNSEDLYGFLSRSGLLPNYAFPEEGVSLRTVIRRKQEDDDKAKWMYDTHEYTRAAAVAISEFAPGNVFYANGRHFEVDQVDLATSKSELWRLCPNCSHGELVTPSTAAASCPKCGHPGWADSGQVMEMLKLQAVISNADDVQSLTDDSSERREQRFFSRQTMVEVDEGEDVGNAWHLTGDGFDFGFEFDKRVILREVNFGQASSDAGRETYVAGQSRVRPGFRVCGKCGRIERDVRGARKIDHALSCPVYNKEVREEDAVIDCMFLYREFASEALRVLIPETTFASEGASIVDSFVAAIMLGLRKKFGNVDHLLVTVQDDPIGETGYRKQYLVVYDSVPGGTGYLKQLADDGEAFLDVLRTAKEAMDACGCNEDPQKDGCYHCLFAYRTSRSMDAVSRTVAQRVLADILDPKNVLSKVSSVAQVPVNNLFDSELERMFVEALGLYKGANGEKASCTVELVNGKQGYRLVLGDAVWEVEPQVDLGPAQGVSVPCRPDFVLYPIVPIGKHCPWKPVAVFTDGFEFHKQKVGNDTCKRAAIMRSGRYRVWSLSWRDVENAGRESATHYLNCLKIPELPQEGLRASILQMLGGSEGLNPANLSSFEMLGWYLSRPNAEELFSRQASSYAVGMLETGLPSIEVFEAWKGVVEDAAEQMTLPFQKAFKFGETFLNVWAPSGAEHLKLYAGSTLQDVNAGSATAVVAILDDSQWGDVTYRSEWNGFLHLTNLMQFFMGYAAASVEGLESGAYDGLGYIEDLPILAPQSNGSAEWAETEEELLDDESRLFAKRLQSLGAPPPDEVGCELEGGEMAEMVWTSERVCFLMDEQIGYAEVFRERGWNILLGSMGDEELLNLLGV